MEAIGPTRQGAVVTVAALGAPTPALPRTRFSLPPGLEAGAPPEARGLARDQVRLLVARPGGIEHARFRQLDRFLDPGDLLVVNTSATLPAACDGVRAGGGPVLVHFSTALDDGTWLVELRPPGGGQGPLRDAAAGERVELAGGAHLHLLAGYPDGAGGRLWWARVRAAGGVLAWLARAGRPIRYGYVQRSWPLSAYQTVFAREPGSAEMPSAGRPFTTALVTRLVAGGVAVAPLLLHTGVASLEAGEPPLPERFRVPAATARLVEATRRGGGRVVAVGTTVTRALESATRPDGTVVPAEGWTELVLGPDRPARVVDGLVTGLHAPEASHLLLLEAVAGPELVGAAYREAVAQRYLWHEFGDSCLLLPERRAARSRAA
jgi:S-adenosylmethionine:tRNA ribosyltransferase-isomerase